MPRLIPALLPLLLLALAACGEVEDTRPGQPVKQRQTAFKEIIKIFEPMGTMLRTKRYDADRFAMLATELVARRDGPWAHFGPDTDYPPTKAKAEVWSKAAEFEQERKAFMAATDDLKTAAQGKQLPQVEAAYKRAYETCQSCHKGFKEK
jgi:cytochrome c556